MVEKYFNIYIITIVPKVQIRFESDEKITNAEISFTNISIDKMEARICVSSVWKMDISQLIFPLYSSGVLFPSAISGPFSSNFPAIPVPAARQTQAKKVP